MRISGIEPSSMILPQQYSKRFKCDVQRMPKQVKTKRDGVINPQNYKFQSVLNTENVDVLTTLSINLSLL